MKKYFKYFILMLILLSTTTPIIHAANTATLSFEFTGYYYERYKANGERYTSKKLEDYHMDGEIAYCIEPDVPEGLTYLQGNFEDTGLSNEIKERMLLIGYYGQSYPGHDTLKYKAAAQALIWKAILGENSTVKYSTARYGEGTALDISEETAEIEYLIAHHYDRPSFSGEVYKAQVGQTITLVDTNNVLSLFDINVNGAEYSVDGNVLTIKPLTDGKIDIIFEKKQVYVSNYKFFVGDEIQNMFVPGTVDPVVATVRINTYYSPVEFVKKDKETNTNIPQGQATLSGAVYGVYDNETDNLITTITTDENGYGKSDNVLSYNTYYLQEISASTGYLLDDTKYYFDMREKESETIEVFEQPLKNYISILKQYDYVNGNTTFLSSEGNITFEIYYPNGEKYAEITTNKHGYATINLPYGVWKFHQVNTTTGFEKIYDFNITVDNNSEQEQYYNILNNSLTAYLQVFKTDAETGENIALANTTFKILNTDTNEYVSQYVGGKVYSEFKTDDEGKFITYLKLVAGNYKLIEITSPKGYLLDNEGLNFSIGNDTQYNYTNYGPFITIYYKNSPIKAQIEIIKNGETFNALDQTFNYDEKISLHGIKFNIYAEEDIKSSDGNYLYYGKDELVDTIITDENGYAISKKLPLGKYRVIEVETKEDYVLDETEYFVELTEIDNKTVVVYKTLELTNILKKGRLEFTKTDFITGDVVPNTTIEIYTDNDELIFTGKTDDNGKVIVNELKVGKYYILEKEAATGYLITDEIVNFEIKDNGEIVKAEMKNKSITGTVEITKIDISTSEPLPNALIEIYNDKDELVYSGRTNEEGKITIDELRYGKYYFLEKEAPEGYTLNPNKMYFEILEDGEIIKCTMQDEKIVVEVPKTLKNDYMPLIMFGVSVVGLGAFAYEIKKYKKRK